MTKGKDLKMRDHYKLRESINPNAKQIVEINRFESPSNKIGGNASALDKNYKNSTSVQR